MLHLVRPSEPDLQRVLDKSRQADLSYSEVGATKNPTLPAGYRVDHYERRLGSEEGRFERAVDALRRWQGQIGAGIRIFPNGATVEMDSTVLFVLRTIGLWAIAPCRVIYVIDEQTRFGFAYGTLPGHPERGEVAMIVSREDGDVVARIESFSRTVDPLARAASPVTRVIQKRVTSRYLGALATASKVSRAGY